MRKGQTRTLVTPKKESVLGENEMHRREGNLHGGIRPAIEMSDVDVITNAAEMHPVALYQTTIHSMAMSM